MGLWIIVTLADIESMILFRAELWVIVNINDLLLGRSIY